MHAAYDNNEITKYIDMCALNSSHYDIALVCHKYLLNKHRYIKNNIWEYMTITEKGEDIWSIDNNNEHIIYSIKTIICSAFTERSIYWSSNKPIFCVFIEWRSLKHYNSHFFT